jgi:hypothetical protein
MKHGKNMNKDYKNHMKFLKKVDTLGNTNSYDQFILDEPTNETLGRWDEAWKKHEEELQESNQTPEKRK